MTATKNLIEKHFALKAPCSNCPFRIEGAIELEDGRLDGIIDDLLSDDHSTFHCHKTVHHSSGGEWDDDGKYNPSGNEAMCAGAIIYLEKARRPTVGMRLGHAYGFHDSAKLKPHFQTVIDPQKVR
jgi:hypothetical protein